MRTQLSFPSRRGGVPQELPHVGIDRRAYTIWICCFRSYIGISHLTSSSFFPGRGAAPRAPSLTLRALIAASDATHPSFTAHHPVIISSSQGLVLHFIYLTGCIVIISCVIDRIAGYGYRIRIRPVSNAVRCSHVRREEASMKRRETSSFAAL